jgi:DtxR family Mn-dependent transcriptional regulator
MAKAESLSTKKFLTPAHEDYLKAIYTLKAGGNEVSNSALASYLSVSPASATNMVKKLAELSLVEYTPYQSVTLTPTGERMALEVLRHHRLVELYLHEKLNLPWDQIHAEADRLEHVISEVLEDAMAAALNDPTIDPHGDPIPSKDGQISKVEGAPLSIAELNRPYRVVRVLVQDPERLSYLGGLGLYPQAMITLLKRAPFSGPLLIDVAGEHHALAHEMAEQVVVAPAGQPA